jgi:hypothetical protein
MALVVLTLLKPPRQAGWEQRSHVHAPPSGC